MPEEIISAFPLAILYAVAMTLFLIFAAMGQKLKAVICGMGIIIIFVLAAALAIAAVKL